MPVITRNQYKNNVNFINSKSTTTITEELKNIFIDNVKKLCTLCVIEKGISNRMKVCLEMFTYINEYLPKIIEKNSINLWPAAFVAVVFNKSTEFINEFKKGNWEEIDITLVENFNFELDKARNYTISLIKENWDLLPDNYHVIIAKKDIAKLEQIRPRRNIPRVDYTGMDSIEPEDEFDAITDIWYDETLCYDSDYVFEEDEDEDEEDYEEKYQPKWAKIYPELN